jgi:tetratricopeptide (TPR) repeat protein
VLDYLLSFAKSAVWNLRNRLPGFIFIVRPHLPNSWSTFVAAGLGALVFLFAAAPAIAQIHSASPSTSAARFADLSAQADAARDANRLDEALVLYKKALALRPAWAEGWWSLGTISYDQNSYAEAARAFQKVTQLAPRNGTAYVMLGLSEFELGHDDLALKHIDQGAALGLDKDPELRHVALYHQGVLLQRQGKFQAARETLEQLCLQGVQSDEVAIALGMSLLRNRGRTPPSRGSADGEIVARVGHAACLSGQKKFDEARTGLSAVVGQYPKYPGIHYAFGLILVEASELPAAVAEFKQEIENNPADIVSRLEIAAALYKTDSAAGIPYAEEAVKLAPQQPFGHYLLGMLLLDTDSYEKATPELEIAQKAFPHEARIDLALGTAYSRAGRKQDAARARAAFQRLTEEGNKSGAGVQGADDAKIPIEDAPSPEPPPQP